MLQWPITYMLDLASVMTNVLNDADMRDVKRIVSQRQLTIVFDKILPYIDGVWQATELT
jgi:hypothetical protein